MLAWYQERFDTVEINNSFYRLPSESAVEEWRASAPPGFRFSVKGSRFLTHMKKLKDPGPGLEKFFSRINLLKSKLGAILFQLPPNFESNPGRLDEFLDALPPQHRYAFEFRHESWHNAEILRLLRVHNAAWCAFHLAGVESAVEITADIAYIRLHGPGGKYQGSYSDDALKGWSDRIKAWRNDLKTIYVYFDNDDSGYAAKNALRLRELAGE
jgi:uncharacterized protein YecE (DUF72 family)